MPMSLAATLDLNDLNNSSHVDKSSLQTSLWPDQPRGSTWNALALTGSDPLPANMPRPKDIKDVFSSPSHPTLLDPHQTNKGTMNDAVPPSIAAKAGATSAPVQPLETLVKNTAVSLLGPSSLRGKSSLNTITPHERHSPVYVILSRLLTFTPHSGFWWKRLAGPFSSMLQTSRYSALAQCRFLCFVYGTVIDMMAPHDTPSPDSFMTVDGSPVELSWVLPTSPAGSDIVQTKPRQVRFAIEPMHITTGRRLKGSVVLDYLTSPRGSLGLVISAKDAMTWRTETEKFLFPNAEGDEIPDGSRFFVGFDFLSNGMITLKAYYLPPPPAPAPSLSQQSPITLWDVDYAPMRRLVAILDPTLLAPLEMLLSYFESLEDEFKPRIQIISMDCVEASKNRLKIYCRPKAGTSWSDAVRSLTLGGRLASPQMNEAINDMERLWNSLFPYATSMIDCGLSSSSVSTGTPSHQVNGIKLDQKQHPVGGLLYYYSLVADKILVYPKIYLPVTHYCSDDLFIARAIEEYYNDPRKRNKKAPGKTFTADWVTSEVMDVFKHRSLNKRTGLHTYVTFAVKKNGTELTNYFSPEPYNY